jgi:opacity protein-like surface antigen
MAVSPCARAALLLLGLFLSLATSLSGQEEPAVPGANHFTVVPLVGVGFQGTRFSRDVELAGGEGFEETLGPTDGLVLGLGVDTRIRPNVWLATGIAYSRLNYAFEQGEDEPGRRVVGGSQDLVRATGGVLYRVRAGASGFFSGGGLGADLGGGRHRLRLEGRAYVVRPGADPARRSAAEYEPRGVAFDFAVLAGLVFPL